MEKELSKSDRSVRAKDRIDEKVAQMGEQAMQDQEEIDPDVTEFVDGPEESREDASHLVDDGRQAETLVEEDEVGHPVRKRKEGETWTTLEQTSEAVTESPQGYPKPRNEGSRRRTEKVWTKP